MPRCSASGCRNMGSHTFPKDPIKRILWEKAINKENFKASKHSRLCYDHFQPSDYADMCLSTGMTPFHRYLKKSAVPSIFLRNVEQSGTSGARVMKAKTSSRQQISRHLKKGAVPTVFPWTKKPASTSDVEQHQEASSRVVLKKIAVPSKFPWNEANSGVVHQKNKGPYQRRLAQSVKKFKVQTDTSVKYTTKCSEVEIECKNKQNDIAYEPQAKFLKRTVVPSIFSFTKTKLESSSAKERLEHLVIKRSLRKLMLDVTTSLTTSSQESNKTCLPISSLSMDTKSCNEVKISSESEEISVSASPAECVFLSKGDQSLRKFLRKTAVPSIFSNPSKFALTFSSSLRQISSPPKNNNDIKNDAVSPQNTPIKEEESTSSDINNALRNRSVRLKNRKAYLLNRKCSVPLCNSRPSNEISLHPCPNNAAVRNEWADALRVSYQYVKNMVACSLHFTKLNFIQSSNSERILKHNAVPSRNLPTRKKVVVAGKNKLLRKDVSSNAFERQQKMTGTTVATKEELIPEELIRECRACLKKLDSKKSCCNVFQAWAPPWDGMEATIAEDLAKLANVEISQQDRHSKVLCAPCYQMLLDAATFAANVRNCDLLLRMRFTADIDMEKVWPKPIQVDKNINGSVFNTSMDIEIKQEVVSDEEYPVNGTDNPYAETELSTLDIKIEPEELVEPPPMNITINGTISLDPLNSENKDVKKGAEVIQETNCIVMEIKQEPTSDGEQEIEQSPDLSLECLLCTKSFNSVTGLKAHVIAQHSYKTVKRKADGSVSPEKKRCDLHQCAICKRSFQTPTDLMVHETCHNKLACYGCTEKFDSFELLTRHRKRCKASIGNSVQKLKTLEDVKRPLPEEKVEYLELEIERVEPETTDKEQQDIEMKELETIKHEDVEMKDLINEQKEENQDSQENKAEGANDKAENDKTLECGNEEVEKDIKLNSSKETDDDKKPESAIEEVDNDKKPESVVEVVDSGAQLKSVIQEDNDMQLESLKKVNGDEKLLCVIEEVDSVIKEEDSVENLESIIKEDSDNKTAESIKEELTAEVSKAESEFKELEEDPDSKMKLHLEIHSTKNETEPTLGDADMPIETLDNDDCI